MRKVPTSASFIPPSTSTTALTSKSQEHGHYWEINLVGMMQIQNRTFIMEIVEVQSYWYTGVLLPLRQKKVEPLD